MPEGLGDVVVEIGDHVLVVDGHGVMLCCSNERRHARSCTSATWTRFFASGK